MSARRELADYYAAVDRSVLGLPCVWYDAAARACRHYAARPGVCRAFRVGSPACMHHRVRAGRGSTDEG